MKINTAIINGEFQDDRGFENAPIFKNLASFGEMVEKSLRKNDSVDNSDARTEKDYGDGDLRKADNEQ